MCFVGLCFLVLGACSSGRGLEISTTGAPASATDVPADSGRSTTTIAFSEDAPVETPQSTTTLGPPEFAFRVAKIEGAIADRVVGVSWREGCPLGLEDLRYVEVSFFDFSGRPQRGELVVAETVVGEIIGIFEVLFDDGFAIERMELVSNFEADDLTSILANNTSAFNCRFVEGTQNWSDHAFGRAIDINPLINPWVRGSSVSPAEGAQYADRSVEHLGGIYPDTAIVEAFEAYGWTWGGSWAASKDYQHFSTSGQ